MTVGVRVCKLGDTVFVEEEWRIVDSQCSGESKCRMTHEEPEQKHCLSWLGVRCRRGGARKKQTDLGFSQGFYISVTANAFAGPPAAVKAARSASSYLDRTKLCGLLLFEPREQSRTLGIFATQPVAGTISGRV